MEKENLLQNRYILNSTKENYLGRGSYATVYRGFDKQTNTYVAIKLLPKSKIKTDNYLFDALKKELEILRICESSYSTKLIDHFEDNIYIYIILELCDNDLDRYLTKIQKPLSLNQTRLAETTYMVASKL